MLKNSVKYVKYTKYNWQLAISNWQGLPKIGHSEQLQFCLLPIVYRLLAIPKTLLSPEHYKYTHHFLADGGGRNKGSTFQLNHPLCQRFNSLQRGKISRNIDLFPLPLQPIKSTGPFIVSMLLIINLL
jgi:hypothetical protein